MVRALRNFARQVDVTVSRAWHHCFVESPSLIILLFHAVVADEGQRRKRQIDPRFCLTVDEIRRCVRHFLDHNYSAVSPRDVLEGLSPDHRYVMLTFDDGYFNNTLVTPLLEEYDVPAMFAISTDHVRNGKSFWWDVLYRETMANGAAENEWQNSLTLLTQKPVSEIEEHLTSSFGESSLTPVGDIDRPFTPNELREFAAHKHVILANHTARHDWLSGLNKQQLEMTLGDAQDYLTALTGVRPLAVAYPFGNASDLVIEVARSLGLELGFTTALSKQTVPVEPTVQGMRLPRFQIVADLDATIQGEMARFDWRMSTHLRRAVRAFLH